MLTLYIIMLNEIIQQRNIREGCREREKEGKGKRGVVREKTWV